MLVAQWSSQLYTGHVSEPPSTTHQGKQKHDAHNPRIGGRAKVSLVYEGEDQEDQLHTAEQQLCQEGNHAGVGSKCRNIPENSR
eukprot:1159475-Pelagomonas_calceolata.AAC.8